MNISVQLLGYCAASPARIATLIEAGKVHELVRCDGNFVIVATREKEVWIITSAYGVVGYFFSAKAGSFNHGPTLADVIARGGIAWKWNHRALSDLFALEHLLGDDTLHAEVQRAPAATVLHWDGSVLHRWSATWDDLHQPPEARASAARMVEILREEVARWAGPLPVLSASGGFDSRVLLAALLANGAKPKLIVQGYPRSTDRVVVEAIARRFGLNVCAVESTPEDYMRFAQRICRVW